MELNRPAPDFELHDLGGGLHRLSDQRGRIVIVNFWSCECPHSERTDRALVARLAGWGPDVILLPVASNRSEPAGAVEEAARARRLPRVLIDAAQAVADLYEAQTTPHAFLVDRDGLLRYRGAVDDVSFRQRTLTHLYLEQAVDAVLRGESPDRQETPAFGCAIVREH